MSAKPVKKQISRIDQFREIINESKELDLMKACQGVLRDKIQIFDLETQAAKLQAVLYDEQKRKFFSFFLEGLSPDEILALADKCSGRVKILEAKAEVQAAKDAENKSDVVKE